MDAKEKLRQHVESKLSESEAREALRDSHSRRAPLACGMTIHTGIGCGFGCLYCYVPDMGFPMRPRPYPLSGLQLVYALLSNPYFLPGPLGTLLAFGSVTEPFMPEAFSRTIEYLESTRTLLGNPQQISTKGVLDEDGLEEFLRAAEPKISVLVSVSTLRYARVLEPAAPPPEKRFEFIGMLAERGIHVSLFLRPLIPSVIESELDEILLLAKSKGAQAVIPGVLRVTPGILRRLKASGVVDVDKVVSMLPRMPRNNRDQVPLAGASLRELVRKRAEAVGLKVLPSSCAANVESHGLGCSACKWGPCGQGAPQVYVDDVDEMLEVVGCNDCSASIVSSRITIACNRRMSCEKRARILLETLLRRKVIFRVGRPGRGGGRPSLLSPPQAHWRGRVAGP